MANDLSSENFKIASDIINEIGANNLPPKFAKLYSHSTKIFNGQQGLANWNKSELEGRFKDVFLLIELGFYFHELGNSIKSSNSFKRAAELLEWLNNKSIVETDINLSIMTCALYQVSGFSARASSVLKTFKNESPEIKIFKYFLKSNFKAMPKAICDYWEVEEKDPLLSEFIKCIGILYSFFRWGDDQERIIVAKKKVLRISNYSKFVDEHSFSITIRLLSIIFDSYLNTSMRENLIPLSKQLSEDGTTALDRYLRSTFQEKKPLIWPSQKEGVRKLISGSSFVLCTPTGSGKTTVAELAIMKSLFDTELVSPLVMYLTPSKALATEVEKKLSKVLKTVGGDEIVVTGLYGGTDWGPTDAWLTQDKKTLLVCTYEKAEALIRFLGPLFVNRISLIVIDEIHSVQTNYTRVSSELSDSRALRLESLISRLLSHLDKEKVKFVGLSAVAKSIEQPLAKWIEKNAESKPVKTSFRSTRQLIGRLEVEKNRTFITRYDILDSKSLTFDGQDNDLEGPYVIHPIPKDPTPEDWKTEGVEESKLRSCALWSAIHFAGADENKPRSVLISVMQGIDQFAGDFLDLLNTHWKGVTLPEYFVEPTRPSHKKLYENCLASCEDYFGLKSREYKLLLKGIVVHHGKMPGLMARQLIDLIDKKIINVVLATSTLSEGINLPFEIILLPSLLRFGKVLPTNEFMNLVGRAGRPGVATEGQTLVILPGKNRNEYTKLKRRYDKLKKEILANIEESEDRQSSALFNLLRLIKLKWEEINGEDDDLKFISWIESTTPSYDDSAEKEDKNNNWSMNKGLDSLDSIILSAIVEIENFSSQEFTKIEWEQKLISLWNNTFAKYSSDFSEGMENIIVTRGNSIRENIYKNDSERKQIYCTSLPPSSARKMLAIKDLVIQKIQDHKNYIELSDQEKLEYFFGIIEILSSHDKFKLPKINKKTTHQDVFTWWLAPALLKKAPNEKEISRWFDYISKNILYKFNWALGSIYSVVINEVHKGILKETKIEEWPKTGLPWIGFWIKDMMTWGVTCPVAAFSLGSGAALTRREAIQIGLNYYTEAEENGLNLNDNIFDPRKIRDWVDATTGKKKKRALKDLPQEIFVHDLCENLNSTLKKLKVFPIVNENIINWIDVAGYDIASSKIDFELNNSDILNYDFELDFKNKVIRINRYL